jgi:hypothetical protein
MTFEPAKLAWRSSEASGAYILCIGNAQLYKMLYPSNLLGLVKRTLV